MQLKSLLVFAAITVSMWTVKAATDTADGASTIDSTSNSVYAALCAAGQSKYCGRVKPATETATGTATSGTGDAPLLDTSTGTAIYDAMCQAGIQSYCGKTSTTKADQTARDNAVKCILGAYEFCNQATGTGTGTGSTATGTDTTAGTGNTGGTGSTGCASWGGGSGCADGADGSTDTGTGTTGSSGNATSGIKDPKTQQAVNDVLCKARQKAYCTGGITPTSDSSSDGGGGLMPEINLLTGDAKTACEVILCLASGQRPDECIKPLDVFFSIVKRTLSRTISARKDFLELCPVVAENDFLKQLTSAQAQGAGRCDVAALNQNYSYVGSGGEGGDSTAYVSSSMPSYCTAMANLVIDPTTGTSSYPLPVYVGVPERGGYWVDPKDYATALARYEARVKAEDQLAAQSDNGGGGP